MENIDQQLKELATKRYYEVHCGAFVFTCDTREGAEYHAQRIGLARCEDAEVINPIGEVVYTF